jgi:hypothetical protein
MVPMPDLVATIHTAVGETTAQQTARLAWYGMLGTPVPSEADLQGEGVVEFRHRRVHMDWRMMTMRMVEQSRERDTALMQRLKSAFGEPREIAFDGGRRYVRLDDGRWWSNSDEESGPRSPGDPTWSLDAVLGVTEATSAIGTETVRGVRTRRVRCTVDLRKADLVAEPAGVRLPDRARRRWPWRRRRQGWETRLPAEVWVDGGGLVRRLSIAPVPHLAKGESGELWSSVEFWDFNVACQIEVPATDG